MTQNYDFDLGTLPIQDWYYATAFQESLRANVPGPPPVADNALINGTMKNTAGQGSYHKNTITKGKKYKVRIIKTSLDNHFKVHLDGHNLTVVSSDLVPVIPYPTDWLFVGIGKCLAWIIFQPILTDIGQRHDVIINANQAVGNYWFRAEAQGACDANKNNGNIKAIFSYDGAPAGDPQALPQLIHRAVPTRHLISSLLSRKTYPAIRLCLVPKSSTSTLLLALRLRDPSCSGISTGLSLTLTGRNRRCNILSTVTIVSPVVST
jgi:Multicopper oxidase